MYTLFRCPVRCCQTFGECTTPFCDPLIEIDRRRLRGKQRYESALLFSFMNQQVTSKIFQTGFRMCERYNFYKIDPAPVEQEFTGSDENHSFPDIRKHETNFFKGSRSDQGGGENKIGVPTT